MVPLVDQFEIATEVRTEKVETLEDPMTIILEAILAYFINLAAGERSAAIAASREGKVKEVLDEGEALKKALASSVRSATKSA